MSSRNNFIDEKLYDYILEVSLREIPVLTRLRQETASMPETEMQISPDQGQFMSLLVKLIGARKIVEVGCFTGYSSTVMAQALPEDGRLVTCDISEQFTTIAQRYWREAGVSDKIELRLGDAGESLKDLLQDEAGTFDLTFIDADKTHYAAYVDDCLLLLRPGGLMLIDNVLWQGRVAEPTEKDDSTFAIRKLNTALRNDERVDLSLLSIGDGLTLARKR